MSVFSKWLFGSALFLVLLTTSASPSALARVNSQPAGEPIAVAAPDAPLPLNHFYCYNYTGPAVAVKVKLQDQFSPTRARKAIVREPSHFCNPVQKTHNTVVSPILFRNDHLIIYNIGTHVAPPVLQVRVRNQFGKQTLDVFFPAEVLMVPTRKAPHDKPNDTDHFKCYAVTGQPVAATVALQDQWRQTQVVVIQPFGLCNPTRKLHNGVWTEVKHAEAHLVCYRVTPQTFTIDVKGGNQFRKEKFTVQGADVLCVPSRKRIID